MSAPAADNAEKTNQEINDEENQSQNSTLRRIQRFRDDIAEYQLLFAQNEITHEIGEDQQHRSYHQLARGFLQLLKPYLTDEEMAQSEYYWNQVELGSFTIDPPDVIRPPERAEVEFALRDGNRQALARADPRNTVESKRYDVVGLRDFAAAQPEWTVEWQVMYGPETSPADLRQEITSPRVHVSERTHRNEPITVIHTARIPRQIIDAAITAMENFVRALGMDIDFKDEEQQTKIDRELLEEVEEWRQQNIE